MFRRWSALLVLGLLSGVVALTAAPLYKGAIVLDADSGTILLEENADVVAPPASITKLMSFLVVQDFVKSGRISLRTPVTVSAADARMGGTQVWLKEGEVFEVEELLMAMMIQSANDAAHALASAAAGSRDAFVAAMNERARQLGMTRTIWRTPHGLPPRSRQLAESDVTSPRDLALLSRALLRETDVLRYTSIALATFGEGKRAEPVLMDNHNNLVGKVRGVDGLKTGFTRAAGFCLAATAEREGRRLIAVIMGAPTSKERDVKMAELLEAAFAQLGPAPTRPPPAASPINPARAQPLPSSTPAVSEPVAPPAPSAPPVDTPVLTRVPLAPDEAPPPSPTEEPPAVKFTLPK